MKSAREICSMAPVIPVLVIEQLETAGPLAQALIQGGLPVLEVTLRTPVALDAIKVMAAVPGAVVGAGTVLTKQDLLAAKQAGAVFAVAPGATDALLQAAEEEQFPLLPGAATASEVMKLMERGYDTLKFFPAQAAGGVKMLKSLAGPLPQVSFCPTGGVSPQNVGEYLSLSNVLCVGGTWITPSDKINSGDWAGIQQLAQQASQVE
jgi:2-dehydro-3-deoxyphosphogluconate aldolase / (4S)-4-hydroxy-2-oxoglutarate aldolase